jgi:hypothetical protein
MSGELLNQIVKSEPGLQSIDIYHSLVGDELEGFDGPRSIDRALRQIPDLVHEVRGRWFPGPAAASSVEPEVTPPPRDEGEGPQSLETELRDRLRGRRLIAEVGLDAALHERVTSALEDLLRTRPQEAVARTHPYLFVSYLTGHGVYGYERGNFWGSVGVRGIDNAAGPLFERQCNLLGLEDFSGLVRDDRATRYVGPMLAHGGIPKYCLADFFSLIIRDMQRAGGTADDLLAHWRTKKTAFFDVDKPVGRFLLYGGDLAVDLLDRCLAAIIEVQSSNRIPTPSEAGLPPYFLVGLRRHVDEIRQARPPRSNARRDALRPRLILDPWSPLGPELELPPVPTGDRVTEWRVWTPSGIDKVDSSTFETKHVSLRPSRSWHVELLRGGVLDQEWTFEGYDASPAMLFDARDGQLLASARSVRGSSVWVVSPQGSTITTTGAGEPTTARLLEEVPDLGGGWSGFSVSHVSLIGARILSVEHTAQTMAIRVQAEAARAQLLSSPVDRIHAASGVPVYDHVPVLQLPIETAADLALWRAWMRVGDAVIEVDPEPDGQVRFDASLADPITPSATIQARGPLGSDFRQDLAIVRDLVVAAPDRLLFPGERHAPVSIGGAMLSVEGGPVGSRVDLPVPSQGDTVQAKISHGDVSLLVEVRVQRLLWAVADHLVGALDYAAAPVTVAFDALVGDSTAVLAIRTGARELPLELNLVVDGKVLQQSDRVKTGRGDGRWAFDLALFRDTLRSVEGSLAEFHLVVGLRPVTVMRVRSSVGVTAVSAEGGFETGEALVAVAFVGAPGVQHRVARLWPVDRPWAPVIAEMIPDGTDRIEVKRSAEALPPGRYLVEVEVDDGWTTPARPMSGAGNTVLVTVGDDTDRTEYLQRLASGDGLAIMERALHTRHIARPLLPAELIDLGPAALACILFLGVDPDPGLRPPSGLHVVGKLLCADPQAFASAVTGAAADGRLGPREALLLALLLGERLHKVSVLPIDDDSARMLWSTAPALAALLDLANHPDDLRDARLRAALGWIPADGVEQLFTGAPVDQALAGRSAELLELLRSNIDLVPQAVLDADTLVIANFEWLIAARSERFDVRRFWGAWSRQVTTTDLTAGMTDHLDRRTAPAGTEAWASFPRLTLAAAIRLAQTGGEEEWAADLLREAADHAPKLVERDIVLAQALHVIAAAEPPEHA